MSLLAGMAKLAPGAAEAVNCSLPLGHAQATWDIGMSAVFLASNGARCISGDTLVAPLLHTSHTPLAQQSSLCGGRDAVATP